MTTRAEYRTQFQENSDYESDLSGAKCRLFIQACRNLRMMTPSSSAEAQGGLTRFEIGYNVPQLQDMEDRAIRWMAANGIQTADQLANLAKPPRQFGFERMGR